jgi:hypothetical protein
LLENLSNLQWIQFNLKCQNSAMILKTMNLV